MNLSCLSEKTLTVFNKLKSNKNISLFYLAGGTGLALQLNHRESEDLDFFIKETFSQEMVLGWLSPLGKIESTQISSGTLNTYLDGVKLQFLHYPYICLKPLLEIENIRIASVEDIACMKLIALSDRGSKKDFIDLYEIMKIITLKDLLFLVQKKFVGIDYNETHLLKSLVYFKEAEKEPSPRLIKEISWEKIKTFMIEKVRKIKII